MENFQLLNFAPADHDGEHRYVHVIGSHVWVDDRPAEDEWTNHFLGIVHARAWWAVDVPRGEDPSFGAATDLRSFFGQTNEHEWVVAGRGVQIVEWARTHRFCGRCGEVTRQAEEERAMVCPSCSLLAFPRLSPAMITLVTRGEPGPNQEALLARGVRFNGAMYSCLAGFVEPGESLEDAVRREVFEEVSINIKSPTYFGSQPWPFPNSLMVGFLAEYESGEIICEPTEIVDAGWYRRDNLPNIPPGISIARKLIDAWLLAT